MGVVFGRPRIVVDGETLLNEKENKATRALNKLRKEQAEKKAKSKK